MAIADPTRRDARELVMQALYQLDQNPTTSDETVKRFFRGRLKFPELEAFAWQLYDGVRAHREFIDGLIQSHSHNWSLPRMAPIDRAVLRLAVYELRCGGQTPPKVVIDEAIEICRRYSTAEAPAFVNGILDPIAREGQAEEGEVAEAAASE